MKRNNSLWFALAFAGVLMIAACNSSDETIYEAEQSNLGGVAVTGFSLRSDDDVLNNLDSVFFSIDLNEARIFNADSLPYGTDVSSLGVSLSTDVCSEVKLYYQGEDGESEVDYLVDESAKVDFSNGAVRLHLVSQDAQHSRDYMIEVNVHNVVPDSLFWSEAAYTQLPTSLAAPVEQKTVAFGGKPYCLTSDGSAYCLSVSSDPYEGRWETIAVDFPKHVRVRSFTACEATFYVLADDGELLASNDGESWQSTGEYWNSIIAAYGDRVLGLEVQDGRYCHASYPGMPSATSGEADEDFPVDGYSSAVGFSSIWAAGPQVIILGGRKADGTLSGATWAFDGVAWAKIGEGMKAAEGYAVTEYTISETDTDSWRIEENDVLIAFGGRSAAGVERDVYISRDMGITWKKGDDLLQLPEYMPSVYSADVLVFGHTMSVSSSAAVAKSTGRWHEMPVKSLPSVYAAALPQSRVATLSENWECPFLYMFGGSDASGALQNAVWRGVINHFSFRPLE